MLIFCLLLVRKWQIKSSQIRVNLEDEDSFSVVHDVCWAEKKGHLVLCHLALSCLCSAPIGYYPYQTVTYIRTPTAVYHTFLADFDFWRKSEQHCYPDSLKAFQVPCACWIHSLTCFCAFYKGWMYLYSSYTFIEGSSVKKKKRKQDWIFLFYFFKTINIFQNVQYMCKV